jgi:hypothetical protein
MKFASLLTITICLILHLESFSKEVGHRYFIHNGIGVSEITTPNIVTIANLCVSFTNATTKNVLLTDVDSIFLKNIIIGTKDGLKSQPFKLKNFAVPIGNRRFSVQSIIPLLPGKITATVHCNKRNSLFNSIYQYDGNKQILGVFRLKNRPYFFLLDY